MEEYLSLKKKNSKKILYVIPSALLLFLPDYFHSFRIFVILSGFLSFLPNIVIPSELLSLLPNSVIPSELLPFQIFVILNSSSTLLYRKGEKIGRQSRPYLQVSIRSPNPCLPRALTCQWQWFLLSFQVRYLLMTNWLVRWQFKRSEINILARLKFPKSEGFPKRWPLKCC